MGVTYYAHYFDWFEVARTEYFRAIGLVYAEFEKRGIFLPVAEANCRYSSPAAYDDEIVVRTMVAQLKRSLIRFEYEVLCHGNSKPIATGYTVHVFSNRDLKPIRIPEELREKVELMPLEA
jgi:acyl-CoA thioester hydrolase